MALANAMGALQIWTEDVVVRHTYRIPEFKNASKIIEHMKQNHSDLMDKELRVSPPSFKDIPYSRGYYGALALASCASCWFSIFLALKIGFFSKKVLAHKGVNSSINVCTFS